MLFIGCLDVASYSSDLALDISSQSEKIIISQTNDAPSLDIPVNCNLGQNCFIMHYVDLDPSKAIADFRCGRHTYDGHKGTDFGIADLQVMAEGVPVVAAASGTVLRTRDGIQDKLIDRNQTQTVTGKECGNGVIIDHGNGWSTQYCHLRQGSVLVKPNTQIQQGEVLGMVGASGLASFPHVHLAVRNQGEIVDPFVGTNDSGCNQKLDPLWSQALDYTPTGSIDAGFSDSPPKEPQLWKGLSKNETLTTSSPALVFWVHAYGVLEGDREIWQLTAPDGTVVIDQENTLERPFRSWLSYVGKRNIIPGLWQGEYQLWRDGSLIFKVNRETVVDN